MLAGLAGCACPPVSSAPAGIHTANSCPVELPVVSRGTVEANLLSLPELPQEGGAAKPAPEYRALTAAQAQCLAASSAIGARLQNAELGISPGPRNRGVSLRQAVLGYTAQEVRNRSAGSALELYYHLAEAEGKADLLGQGIPQLEKAVRETREMTAQKLKPPVALDVWTRQLLTAQTDQVQADMTINQLNGELRRMLGLSACGDQWRIWNPEPYDVTDSSIDVDAAVAEGLARRPELLLLRTLSQQLDPASLPAARDMLRSVYPLLGGSVQPGTLSMLKIVAALQQHAGDLSEVEVRRGQLSQYLAEREAAVADEIRQAAAAVGYHANLVALAWAREKSWEEKLRDVESRQKQGLAPSAEVTSTTLDVLKSRSEVIQEVMGWHIARVKLKQAQGLLASECGAWSAAVTSSYCR
jgi:hypothetical protein